MRLTHKHKYKKDSKRFVFDMKDYRKACQKLGQLEDIEEELGIDLITFFKIIWKYGPTIYTKAGHTYDTSYSRHLVFDGRYYIYFYKDNEYAGAIDISQYKETWAFTKEELE